MIIVILIVNVIATIMNKSFEKVVLIDRTNQSLQLFSITPTAQILRNFFFTYQMLSRFLLL